MKKRILVLGCTGSIGSQTLDIARKMSGSFEVCGISAGKNEEKVKELCREFNCKGTVFSKDGIEGLEKLIKESKADIAVNGIAGAAGLKPSVLVLENGIDLALANKETVVMAWNLVKETAKKKRSKNNSSRQRAFGNLQLSAKNRLGKYKRNNNNCKRRSVQKSFR